MKIFNTIASLCATLFIVLSLPVFADDTGKIYEPTRYGMAVSGGNTYDPNGTLTFVTITGIVLYDYDKIWWHSAPDSLRFKIEVSAGTTTRPFTRLTVSAHMFALYYLNVITTSTLKPYIEGGIGFIYNDFRVKGQGMRFNFNPQAGVGTEFTAGPLKDCFAAARAYHVSNGGLHRDNKGLNAVTVMFGRYF